MKNIFFRSLFVLVALSSQIVFAEDKKVDLQVTASAKSVKTSSKDDQDGPGEHIHSQLETAKELNMKAFFKTELLGDFKIGPSFSWQTYDENCKNSFCASATNALFGVAGELKQKVADKTEMFLTGTFVPFSVGTLHATAPLTIQHPSGYRKIETGEYAMNFSTVSLAVAPGIKYSLNDQFKILGQLELSYESHNAKAAKLEVNSKNFSYRKIIKKDSEIEKHSFSSAATGLGIGLEYSF